MTEELLDLGPRHNTGRPSRQQSKLVLPKIDNRRDHAKIYSRARSQC